MKACLLAIAFSCCLITVPVVARADDEVFQWLDRMDAAMSQMNYQGTFVYVRDDNVESMRITHVVDVQGLHERLVSVSGTPREIIRDAQGVRWTSGEDRTVLANFGTNRTLFPELPLEDSQHAALSYKFRLANEYRIAGHSGRRVDIVPKDKYRYGYSLWLEIQSNLLLRWELTDSRGQTLAKLIFTELKMGSEVDDGELRARLVTKPVDATPPVTAPTSNPPVPWKPSKMPPGFRLTSHRLQSAQQGDAYEHLVYSDGIAVVSVYIEAAEPNADLDMGLSKMGTTHVFTREVDGELITVLGDVPALTVKLLGESMVPRTR
jgi:sigma-E factor negative regulatory protein RseB